MENKNIIEDELNDLNEIEEDSEEQEEADPEFLENLAESIDPQKLNDIAIELLDLIEKDRSARKKRDEQYAEGIKRTGLGNEAPGGAMFQGASKVVHPLLVEGCIDFAAKTMNNIFPPSGPCKTQIIGKSTDFKIDKAERKKEYMNWQLTKQISEYRSELEQCLTQVPLGGSQYIKIWYDDNLKRARTEFIPIDDIYLPFSVSHFYSAHRITHRQLISKNTFNARVNNGLYIDISSDAPSQIDDESQSEKASNKIEGKTDTNYNEDGLRTVYEIHVDYLLPDDIDGGEVLPYIITIDDSSRKVLSVYRNWDEEDDTRSKLHWIVEFAFIPWRGAYGIGLPHIIGSMSGALTGALRALMDSAMIANMPGMLKMKGARVSGQSETISPCEIKEIEGTANIDDIRKLMMPLPFPGPSAVLFQLVDWLTTQGKGVVATADEKIADATSNMPVGTTLALIEQGSTTFSSIHARMHAAQAKVLEILHRINSFYLNDEETVEELGELIVSRMDFTGPMDVVPVSDPNIFSSAQRFALYQSVLDIYKIFPDKFDTDILAADGIQLLNYNNKKILKEIHKPERLEAIEENTAASEGKPLKAYDDQDHVDHMMKHMHYALSPIFCANPIMAMPALPSLINHCKEHLTMFYMQNAQAAEDALNEAMNHHKLQGLDRNNPQVKMQAAAIADQSMAQQLAPIMQQLEMAQQAAQKLMPPPPKDPQTEAYVQVEQAKLQAKTQFDNQKLQAETQIKQQKDARDSQLAQKEQQSNQQAAIMALSAEKDATAAEQQTKLSQVEKESNLAVMIEQMRLDAEQRAEASRLMFDKWELERKEQNDLLKHILTLVNQSGDKNQPIGDSYERQQIESAQAISNWDESNGDEIRGGGEEPSGTS